jgi:ABC-type maltose transport system permease subunit
MTLPSQQLLQKYKNIVHQQAGINQDVFHWMANEAKLKKHSPKVSVTLSTIGAYVLNFKIENWQHVDCFPYN